MGGLFLLLFVLIAVLRTRSDDQAPTASSHVDAETVRSFWEVYNAAQEARLRRDYRAAAEAYRNALAIDPKHQDSLFYLAISLESSGKYSEAATVLRELTKLYPEHARAWSQLGTVLATTAPGAAADFDGAETAFKRSEAINPEHTGPFLSRGRIALERGKLDEAAELFRIAADAGAPDGMFLAGFTAYQKEDFSEASKFFLQVLRKSEREAAISGRVSTEGDVEGELTALDRARIRSRWFLFWTVRRLGGYPESVPEAFRIEPDPPANRFERVRGVAGVDVAGRGALVDIDRDGRTNLVIATRDRLRLDGDPIAVPAAWDVVPFDADGDGWEDLYVIGSGYTGTGTNTLLRNDRGRLVDVTEAWGLGGERPTARAVPADIDGDGKTDLLEVGNLSAEWPPVRLFLQRNERFELVDAALHFDAHAVDATVADVDGDERIDVFVLGWKAPGRLFRNLGGSFEDATKSAGLASVGGDGFSALFLDFDVDGDPDLLVTAHAPLELSLLRSAKGPTPQLFENDGRGHFVDHTSELGLDRSFGVLQAVAADVDADGFPDLIFAQGGLEKTHLEPSVVLRNLEGKHFIPWSYLPSADEPRRALGVATSVARADGTFDVFVSGVGILRSPRP